MKTRIDMKTFGWMGALVGMLAVAPAMAQQEGEDILWDYDPSSGITIKPQETGGSLDALFNRTLVPTGSGYVHDLGFDVFPGIDSDITYAGKNIKSLRIVQIGISPELSGIYQFDGATLVWGNDPSAKKSFLQSDSFAGGPDAYRLYAEDYNDPSNLVDPNDPTQGFIVQPSYYHQHFDMETQAVGTFFFAIQAQNVILQDGSAGPNSQIYRINFSNVAAVPEPGAISLMLGMGVCSLAAIKRRRS